MASEDDDSHEGLLHEKTGAWAEHATKHQFRHSRPVLLPWMLSAFFFCTTVRFAWQFYTSSIAQSSNNGTFETGFLTDFVSTTPPIPLAIIRIPFTNDLLFNTTSQALYNAPLDPHETTYIGPPSPEIDSAWHDLLHDQYVAITADEAAQFAPEHRALIDYAGSQHYYFELSVFHNLHCLNEIRMALDHDYYSNHDHARDNSANPWTDDVLASRAHIDHCLDQLRQALQCHADLTPVPMLPVKGGPAGLYIGNGEAHTCRDFNAIREWVKERGEKDRALDD